MRAASSKRAVTLIHRIKRAEAERDRCDPSEVGYARASALVASLRNELAELPIDVEKSSKRETREELLKELILELRALKLPPADRPPAPERKG